MNVTVLAAVGVVWRRTRKKIGQASAVDRTPTAISETAPSSAGVRGAPDRRAAGSATSAPAATIPVASSSGSTSASRARAKLPATA